MKKLLLFMSLILGSVTMNAQLTCDAPTVINAPGQFTASVIAGTYGNDCWGGTETDAGGTLMSNWYSYTPVSNGEVTISSDLAINPTATTDTRISIFTGTCAALECYDGNDDVDVAANNFKSSVTFAVAAGTTYYIAWDNFWSGTGFQFTLAFNAVSCLSPGLLTIEGPTNLTATSATFSWDAAIGNPVGYDIDYGAVGHASGSGTIVNTATTSVTITGLTPTSTYDYYIRGNCGGSQGSWVGPFTFYTAAIMPYANNFDATDTRAGFTFSGWGLTTANANLSQSSPNFIFSNVSTTAASDSYAFFRPIYLEANETVTFNYMAWYLASDLDTATLSMTVGNAPTAAAQTTTLNAAHTLVGNSAAIAWEPLTNTYMAPSTGLYYFAFHNTSAMASDDSSLLVDTVTATSVLSVNDILDTTFEVYPNPASDAVSVSNNDNININTITVADLNGRTVKSLKLGNVTNARVAIGDLSAGMYMMTINTDNGSVVKKIVKK